MNSLYAFRFEIARKEPAHDVLMVFVATKDFDIESFATTVEGEIQVNLVPDELLIVVRQPAFEATAKALLTASQNQATLARLPERTTVTLVGYDRSGKEMCRSKVVGPEPRRKVKLDDFKRRALTEIFNVRHGFVESTSTYHFENPSGRHTDRFIRLSNILVRGAEIAFIGFCTLPFIKENTSVAYLDTPSLYAVVAAVNEQRSSFPDAIPILADNFSSYAGKKSYRFNQIENAVVLISASSSGTLANDLMRDHDFVKTQMTHMLFLGHDKSGSNIVCNLRWDVEQNAEGISLLPAVEEPERCRICASGSHAIKLQGDQFEFAGPQQEPLLIGKDHAPAELGGLVDRIVSGSILGVGLSYTSSKHPRQFDVDPVALLAHPKFRERLEFVQRRSLPASLKHVIAVDEVSEPLASEIAAYNGLEAVVIKRDGLDAIAATTTSAIVIAAAVIESGRSLYEVSRDLRSIAPRAPLLYLVGFSKTTGEPRRQSLERTISQTLNPYPYQLIEIERITLPPSSVNHAWRTELDLLIDPDVAALAPAPLKGWIAERVTRLRRASEPLRDELFLGNSPDRSLRLQPGFVFWPDDVTQGQHTQADVFFTISSVLQQLRANAQKISKSALRSNWFQQTILAPGNFGRFNDDIIQAAILRAAYPFEMNFADAPGESREMGRLIRRIVMASAADRGGAAVEFLLALATFRLRLCKADLDVVLESSSGGIAGVDFLRDVCRTRLTS